jgi:PKD repeat protein
MMRLARFVATIVMLASSACALNVGMTIAEADGTPPTCKLTYQPSTPAAGDPVTFQANAQAGDPWGDIVVWEWDFGDGGIDEGASVVQHQYGEAGTYQALVSVCDDQDLCTTCTARVTVAQGSGSGTGPTCHITYWPTSPAPGDPITFQANAQPGSASGEIVSWEWDFGDGGSDDNGDLVQYQYEVADSYLVTVLVCDDQDQCTACTAQVNVGDGGGSTGPTCQISYDPANPEVGDEVTFQANAQPADPSGEIVSWEWDFGDGSGDHSGDLVQHQYGAAHNYQVSVMVCDDLDHCATCTTEINVGNDSGGSTGPTCQLTYQPTAPAAGDPITFQANADPGDPSGEIVVWQWYFGDGGSDGSGDVVQHQYDEAGAYQVTVAVCDDQDRCAICVAEVQVSSAQTHQVQSLTLDAGWNMISLPAEPVDPDPPAVFAGIPVNLALYRYDPAKRGYIAYNANQPQDFGPCRAGDGYWLYLDQPTTITYASTGISSGQITVAQQGWAMIGLPRLEPAAVAACLVEAGSETVPMLQAMQTGWVESPFWGYQTNVGYFTVGMDPETDADSMLRPWMGYWLCSNPPGGSLSILLP